MINRLSLGEALSAAHLVVWLGVYPFGINNEVTSDYGSLTSGTYPYERAKLAFMGRVSYWCLSGYSN